MGDHPGYSVELKLIHGVKCITCQVYSYMPDKAICFLQKRKEPDVQRGYLYMSGSLSCRNQPKKIAAKDTFRSLCLRRRTYSGVRRVLVRGRIAAVRPQSAPCDESPERLGSDMPKRPFRRNAQKNGVSGAAAGVDTDSHIIDLQKSLLAIHRRDSGSS